MNAQRFVFWTLFCATLTMQARQARAWGEKGHMMSGRMAARKLPKDMPAFFTAAFIELGYLNAEPDRWRNEKREPALRGLADKDHIIKLEEQTGPLPPTRYEYLLAHAGKPKADGKGTVGPRDLGYAPYAIAEGFEMLTVNFMLWRLAPQKTADDRKIKKQIENNCIHIAGVAGHFVADLAMPLHTSIHGDGWLERIPNPKSYPGPGTGIHRRFETDFVNQAIQDKDVEPLLGATRERGPWLDAVMEHARESHNQMERVYQLDKDAPFGAGKEPAGHKQFVCERLAHGTTALRDFWYTAWIHSAELADKERAAASKKPY